MKTILSNNRQLFNVKALAGAGKSPDEIEDNTFGIIDIETGLTVQPESFKSLPEKFRFFNKVNGEVYFSFETIDKNRITNDAGKEYTEPQGEIWKAVVKDCSCIDTVRLDIFLDNEKLMSQFGGLTWSHRDNYVEVSPEEFKCYCDCTGKGVYENNVMTMLLYKNINAQDSAFYEAKVFKEGTEEELEGLEKIQEYIEENKEVNVDDDESNDSKRLELRLYGKVEKAGNHKNIEYNYNNPRGTRLHPVFTINGKNSIMFEKVQELVYERGNGYDLRQEEYSIMSYYTNMITPTLSYGAEDPDLIYQVENGKKYDVVCFDFNTDKQNRASTPEYKTYGVMLVTETGNGLFAKLSKIFKPA